MPIMVKHGEADQMRLAVKAKVKDNIGTIGDLSRVTETYTNIGIDSFGKLGLIIQSTC